MQIKTVKYPNKKIIKGLRVLEENFPENIRDDLSDLEDLLENKGIILIAEEGNEIIGAIYGAPLEFYEEYGLNYENSFYIDSISVKEEYQHKGVGRKLFESLIKKVTNYDKVIFHNEHPENLKDYGIKIIRKEDNWYGEDSFYLCSLEFRK